MNATSSSRRKTAFVPWLACLVIGATAHAGWLIHDLREPAPTRIEIAVQIDARHDEPVDASADASARVVAARRHLLARPELARHGGSTRDELHDLDLWIHERDRYTYTVDRRVLERIATAGLDDWRVDEVEALAVFARGVGLARPIELRNIRAGTPLYLLGLRTGDRVQAIMTVGEHDDLDRVELAIERRGRPISLVYELV